MLNTDHSSPRQTPTSQGPYVEMHRVSWDHGDQCTHALVIAGQDAGLVRLAAARLALTISAEECVPVHDDVILSTEVDLDSLPF